MPAREYGPAREHPYLLQLLAFVYLIAFVSWGVQAQG